ncbi:hypothetical protein OF83DRAFT_830481 [Amylostereum chailletii]|nr:hypothetical protein OF83DRAFT_830481 [Amylostereum chailletii]
MVGNDANLDILQLTLRLTGTAEVANILAKHPEWDKGPRRLHLPMLDKDMRAVPQTADHINPQAWRGNLLVKNTTLATCWQRGNRAIEEEFPFVADQLDRADMTPESSILAPFGIHLCQHGFPPGDEEADDEEDAIEPAQAHSADSESEPVMGEGMCALEEAAADTDWNSHSRPLPFSNVVDVDGRGTMVKKARALAQRFKYHKFSSSTDRLRRVQQEGRYGAGSISLANTTNTVNPADDDEPVLGIGDPISSLLLCDGSLFLCIGEVTGLRLNSKAVDEVIVSLLPEKTVQISYQVLCLIPSTSLDDATLKYDWRSTRLLPLAFTVPSVLAQPINPALATPETSSPFYLFDTETLKAMVLSLRARATQVQLRSAPKMKARPDFPYREPSGMACFLAEAEDDAQHGTFVARCCPKCAPEFAFDGLSPPRILQHVGSHVLYDNSVDRSLEPCGLCLYDYTVCQIYLYKNKGRAGNLGVDTRKSTCSNIIKFSHSIAAESTTSSPCSNAPLLCPLCPPGSPAVWRYNLRAHIIRVHPAAPLPKYEDLWLLSKFEIRGMKDTWRDRHKRPRPRKQLTKVSLVVSDAHRSRAILRARDKGSAGGSDHDEDDETGMEYEVDEDENENGVNIPVDVNAFDDDVIEIEDGWSGGESAGAPRRSVDSGDGAREPKDPAQDISVQTGRKPNDNAPSEEPPQDPNDPLPSAHPMVENLAADIDAGSSAPPLESPRVRRGRKRKTLDGLGSCLCGDVVDEGSEGSVGCRKAGCETRWYHLQCIGLELPPKRWTCDACVSSAGRSKRR